MPEWDADLEMDAELALELVGSQFDEFAADEAELLGGGWDNVAYRIDGRAVFRFPKRSFAVPFLQRETVWLPRVAERLSVAIPLPKWIGEPTDSFEHLFVGYEYIPGTTLCSVDIPRAQRTKLAPTLGEICRELHDLDLSEYGDPPGDVINRRDLDRRMGFIERRVVSLRERGVLHDGAILKLAHDVRRRATDDGECCWVHGDLYARHVLYHEGEVSGLVDWGDLHYGDRAVDLSLAWTIFDFDGRFDFFHAYGEVDDDLRLRAILRAIHYALTLLDYGHDVSDEFLVREGRGALEELLHAEI